MIAPARRTPRPLGHRRHRRRRDRRRASPSTPPPAATTCCCSSSSDFGKGTSSRSTKLVHGGVRYLEQGNISLVMEALKERGLLRQNAPHLVQRPRVRRAQLRLVGGAVLRPRPEGLRPARRASTASAAREILSREETLAAPADDQDRGPARRRRLLRRPVRRRAAADRPGRRRRPSRARRCSTTRRSPASRKAPTGSSTASSRATQETRPGARRVGARVVINADRAVLRRRAPAGRPDAQRR